MMNNIYIANLSDNVFTLAKEFNLGVEIEQFSNTEILDNPECVEEIIKGKVLDIKLRSFHGPFSDLVPASCDAKIREVVKNRFERAYEIANRLNGQHLVLHTGYIPKTYLPKEWLNNSIQFWRDFLSDKSESQLEIHIENVYENDYSLISDLVDAIANPKFSVCLDIGHINANSSNTLDYWIKGLNDKIRHVHLHSNDGVYDNHYGLWKGKIEMLKTLELLNVYAPNASWTIETIPDDIEQSILWLEKNGFIKNHV